ncbi:hypothetical protein HZA97_00275 [Candidatus Woesearchaeota archaeon]|nr:hypothetical protein [Candidatus Woesearchaeota archaeon]
MTEKSLFIEFMGDTPATRLFDLLLTWRDFEYTLTDLTKKAGMSWSTLHRIFPTFIKNKVVIEVREIGRAKLYKLNRKNQVVQKLEEVYNMLIKKELEKHAKLVEA